MAEEDRLQFEDGLAVAVNAQNDPGTSKSVPQNIGDAKGASSTFRSLPTNTLSSLSAADPYTGCGALQQLSDLLGQTLKMDTFADLKAAMQNLNSGIPRNLPAIPINDLRGEDAAVYTRDDCVLRRSLASLYRLVDIHGWSHSIYNHISARSSTNPMHFLINPFGLLYHEIRASSLVKIDDDGNMMEQGSTTLGVNKAGWTLHSALHSARSDVNCIVHVHLPDVIAVSCLRAGLLPVSSEASELIATSGVRYHEYRGLLVEETERAAIQSDLGPRAKVLFLRNHGVAVAAASVPEAWYITRRVVVACQTQMRMLQLAGGASLLAELREAADRLAEQFEQRHRVEVTAPVLINGQETGEDGHAAGPEGEQEEVLVVNGKPTSGAVAGTAESNSETSESHWSPAELEFEAEIRVLDSAGFRTGHVYHQPNLLRRANGAAALTGGAGGGWAGDTLATTGAELGTTDFSATECYSSATAGPSDDVVIAAEAAGAEQVARIADHVKTSRQRGVQRSQWLGRTNEAVNGAGGRMLHQKPPVFPSSESPITKVTGLAGMNGQTTTTATPVKRAPSAVKNGELAVNQQRSDSPSFYMKMPSNKSATLPSGNLLKDSPSKLYTTNTLLPDGRPPLSGDEDEKQKPEKKVKKKGSFRMPSFSRKKK